MAVNAVPEKRCENETDGVDDRAFERSEDRAVHNSEGVRHRERRRRDERKHADREEP